MSQPIRSEIRRDYIQDKYVIIAPRRGGYLKLHQQDINYEPHPPHYAATRADCAFCGPDFEQTVKNSLLTIGGRRHWQILVLPNKYPAVSLTNPKAYGQQEVVVETPKHEWQLEDLPASHLVKLLKVYADRMRVIVTNPRLEYILIFKNNGGRAGASIQHAHSQIFATSFLPPHLADKSQATQAYKLRTGRCIYCDVITKESRGPRLVYLDRQAIAFTPYASMYNYELWILPRRHLDNITNLNNAECRSMAVMLKRAIKKISHQLKLPYNYYFHQVVHDEDQHLYLKITPRGSAWAGIEIGSGLIVNPVSPEQAARFYRQS